MATTRDEAAVVAGPILYARGVDGGISRLTALVVLPEGTEPPVLSTDGVDRFEPRRIANLFAHDVVTYDFSLPSAPEAHYAIGGVRYGVRTAFEADLRIAFVSCNGQERGDADRSDADRNVMWQRLREEHAERPFCLMIHGGDQLYADEAKESHPDLIRWNEAAPDIAEAIDFTPAMRDAARRFFFDRYLALLRQPAAATLYACVPSLMIWDDHDIFDGWGSHPSPWQDSAVARGIFEIAREMFLLFQLGASEEALPATALDPAGRSLSTAARFPGFGVVLPDLRSERTPDRVMGEAGWRGLTDALAAIPATDRRLVISSVPALGPRLSLVERLLDFWPGLQRYEDDLRDQWQSRAHREEWRRLLQCLENEVAAKASPVTLVSGEIHLATRAELRCRNGHLVHQLVASGISHPKPPAAFAFGLGLLSRLGDSPLEGRPITIRPLPGRSRPYTAERNYLVLTRSAGVWSAEWELEDTGRTPRLVL